MSGATWPEAMLACITELTRILAVPNVHWTHGLHRIVIGSDAEPFTDPNGPRGRPRQAAVHSHLLLPPGEKEAPRQASAQRLPF